MPMREVTEDLEAETYSTDAGSEGDADADRKRRRPRRKRRPKPEAIAARLKTEGERRPSRPLPRRARAPNQIRDTRGVTPNGVRGHNPFMPPSLRSG